ncbi:hypothetical protein Q8A73_005555 [Channa argus]|nr:hypothetical protein Q8A73_005555 [Channa argus]
MDRSPTLTTDCIPVPQSGPSQHLFLPSVEGSLPVHGKIYARHRSEVGKVLFFKGINMDLRRDVVESRKTSGYSGCRPAAGWNDISVCQNVKHIGDSDFTPTPAHSISAPSLLQSLWRLLVRR